MQMSNDEHLIKYNMKIMVNNIDKVLKTMERGHYILDDYSYNLDIYMVPKELDKSQIKDIATLEDYVVISDENFDRKVTLYKDEVVFAKISSIHLTRELVTHLGYKELMYVNTDLYEFRKGSVSLKILDVKNQGIYINIEGKTSIVENVLRHLKKIGINFDETNYNVDIIQIELDKWTKYK